MSDTLQTSAVSDDAGANAATPPHSPLVTLHSLLQEWLTTVDHKKIGIMYVLLAVIFLIIGGCEALLMRIQLFWPHNEVIGPDTFNGLFTMHGTTMVFFVGMPILIGMANYLVPLMIGARDMAFPRLNALGFWMTLFGGLLVYFSYATGNAPTMGWFAYAPLTEHTFARSPATDFWALGLIVSGIGTIAAAVNFIATILGMRAPAWPCERYHSSSGRFSGPRC